MPSNRNWGKWCSCIILYLLPILSIAAKAAFTSCVVQDEPSQYIDLNDVDNLIALLVLFNGGAGIAAQIRGETSIPDSAAAYGIKTIGIDQSEFFLANENYDRISGIIRHVMQENNITNGLFLGGFSLGGTTAVRFTEMAVEKGDSAVIPNAIFGVDPPLDHLEMYRYAERETDRECSNPVANQIGKGEAHWILEYYHTNFGSPITDSTVYAINSCFTANAQDGGNAIFLSGIPVNMIHEIDVMWLIEERCRDLSDANVTVSSKFINYLYQSGNTYATLTLTQDKGYRADGSRHPHSWSIAEPAATLHWLMRYL